MPILNKKQKNRANVVDGKLILSLPDAINPVVWQMDLNETKSAALEVEAGKENHALKLKGTGSKSTTIANFVTKEDAVKTLIIAAESMEKAHGKINQNQAGQETFAVKAKSGVLKKTFMIMGGLAILFVLSSFLMVLTGLSPNVPQTSNEQSFAAPGQNDNNGVPMSADDFLKGF